jgi:hypothetical protein
MFRPLFAHLQEALNKRRMVSSLHRDWSGPAGTRNIPSVVCAAPSKDEQVMLET